MLNILKRPLRLFLISLISLLFLSVLLYMFILYGGRLVVDEEALILDETTIIETVDGEMIAELYEENRIFVDSAYIPEHVKEAFVAIEDRRFYDHAGIDFQSVVRAVYRDIIAFSKAEGASTITQQLAKNLFLSHDKTWMRKTKEAMAAIYLEQEFSKDEILELYLNAIYFGHGAYGIEAASQKFFSKSVDKLSVAEGALLAGIINGPNKYSPIDHPELAEERRNQVIQAMVNNQYLTTEQGITESGKTLNLNIKEMQETPWLDTYLDLVIREAADQFQLSLSELRRGGYRIVVNIDLLVQEIAYDVFQEDRYFPGNSPGVEGAFVMLEPETGQVIAALGGRNYQLGDLNRVVVHRQPGSTFKPVAVYGPAMMQDSYHPYSLISDELIDYGEYTPRNYDQVYDGEVTIYDAITQSKNAPAVWLLNEIGIPYAKDYLEMMNITLADNDLSIALGGLREGVTPLQIATTYQMIANDGVYVEPSVINKIYQGDDTLISEHEIIDVEVFSSQVAWDLTEIMQAAVREGTATPGTFTKALAGKTGSTEHPQAESFYKDAWFAGYTPEFVSTVWMGYDHSDAENYLTGGSAFPTELTKDILTRIDQRISLATHFERPAHVESLPKPIELPHVEDISLSTTYGTWPLLQQKLTWTGSNDERVIYHIYERIDGADQRIGSTEGKTSFIIRRMPIFDQSSYYVVPYDPLTGREGDKSEIVH